MNRPPRRTANTGEAARARLWVLAAAVGAAAGVPACGGPPAGDPGFWRPWYDDPSTTAVQVAGGDDDPGAPGGSPPTSNPISDPTSDPTSGPTSPPTSDPTSDPTSPPGGATTAAPCGLTVTVTTASFGGTYAPNNIGAIWVADAHDRFVKTLAVWADRRQEHLERWVATTAAAGLPSSRIDAVSTATKPSHGTRTAAWNCSDATRALAADAAYKICFELTESNGAGPFDCVAFNKGPSALDISPADLPTFKKRRLVFTP